MQKVYSKTIGSVFTAIGFALFIWYGGMYFKQSQSILIVFTAFLLGFNGYLFLRLSKWKFIRWMFVFINLITAYLLYVQNLLHIQNIVILMIIGGVLLLYYPFFRNQLVLKPLVIAATWMLWMYFFIHKFELWFYVQQFIFIFLLTIPFDIGGMERDKIITLPKKLGINTALNLIRGLLLIYLFTGFLLPTYFTITTAEIFLLLHILLFQKHTFKGIWAYVCYDGIIALQSVFFWINEKLF